MCMQRLGKDPDITDAAWEEVHIPIEDNLKDYLKRYVVPEIIAFSIANAYYRGGLCDATFDQHYNSMKDIILVTCPAVEVGDAIDTMSIERRLNNSNYRLLNYIWDLANYEVKSAFIFEYIDTLEIKQYKVRGEKEPRTKILDVKLRPHKLNKLFSMVDSNMLDNIGYDFEENDVSIAEFNSRKQADDYISILQEKYNIRVIDISNGDYIDFYNSANQFKLIRIRSNRAVEKDKDLYLELLTD